MQNQPNNMGYGSPYRAAGYTPPPTPPVYNPPLQKRGGGFLGLLGTLILCVISGAVGAFAMGQIMRNQAPVIVQEVPTSQPSAPVSGGAVDTKPLGIQDIVANVKDTVVEIRTEMRTSQGMLFGESVKSGAGSGVVFAQNGYIITNNHVIEGATNIQVITSKGEKLQAKLIGTDPDTDIAIIQVPGNTLRPATLGDSEQLRVGDYVFAIGNPLGTLGGTVTDGIISALSRQLTINGRTMTLLQTNAAVNPGNSGGALFNVTGQLIGVVNAKSSGTAVEGLGFAVPINTAKTVAAALMKDGKVAGRPSIGITVVEIRTKAMADEYGVTKLGVYIRAVADGSDAAAQGLKAGDYVVSVDGQAVETSDDVLKAVSKHKVGDTIHIQISREGKVMDFNVRLIERQVTTAK